MKPKINIPFKDRDSLDIRRNSDKYRRMILNSARELEIFEDIARRQKIQLIPSYQNTKTNGMVYPCALCETENLLPHRTFRSIRSLYYHTTLKHKNQRNYELALIWLQILSDALCCKMVVS